MRKSLQRPINTINNVYLNDIDIIAGEFCKLLSRANKEQQIVADFLDNLSLVFVECEYIFYAIRTHGNVTQFDLQISSWSCGIRQKTWSA